MTFHVNFMKTKKRKRVKEKQANSRLKTCWCLGPDSWRFDAGGSGEVSGVFVGSGVAGLKAGDDLHNT